jgi:hypothetical protein
VANSLNLFRNGAVGFIDWLDLFEGHLVDWLDVRTTGAVEAWVGSAGSELFLV